MRELLIFLKAIPFVKHRLNYPKAVDTKSTKTFHKHYHKNYLFIKFINLNVHAYLKYSWHSVYHNTP